MHGNCTRFVRELTYEEVIEIERLCRSRNRDIRDRAMVIKLSSQMIPVPEITEQLKRVRSYVLRWIDRFNSEGFDGLNPRPKSGRPGKYTSEYDEKIKALIYERPEDLGLHFNTGSVRKLSEYMSEQGFPISYRTVHRRLKEAKITLKKAQKWMDSKDPKFYDKKNVSMN
ncbi:MAG: helix-turn-helix domain-containing protein [Chloroflexota bacterium]|nr:helix-turn-helix domain-containing protein [Chloroflexota bacterium]